MIVAPASGSVGETIAPSVNAAAHVIPGTSACATSATSTIVTSTSPTELSVTTLQAPADVAEVGEERRAVEQRRQEQDEHHIRIEPHARDARNEPEHRPADHEHDRVGHDSRRASALRPATATSRPAMMISA